MLERDDFQNRFKSNQPISMVEFMYPLIQGYDSVVLESDVEIGGSDQLFNMLVGRNLQKDLGMDLQSVLTMPLLVGLDGVRKMSKSYDNYIAFNDSAKDIFGKVMSLSDDVMMDYFRLLLSYEEAKLDELKDEHPMDSKKRLATELTSRFFNQSIALKELEEFGRVFSKGKIPEEMPTYAISELEVEKASLLNLLAQTNLFDSKGEIRRLIKQGAMKLDGERVDDPEILICFEGNEDQKVVKAGKKIFLRFKS